MCAHWYFAKHFSELSYMFSSKSRGRILDELRVSCKKDCFPESLQGSYFLEHLPFHNCQMEQIRSKYLCD